MPTAKIDGAEIYYLLGGLGKPLLFVHGSGADHTLWRHQFHGLKGSFSIASLDLNGHGQSPRREGNGLQTYAEDVRAVMDAFKEPVFLLGHSLGGAIALTIALQKPKNLQALGLIGTGAKLRVHPKILSLVASDFEKAIEFLLSWEFSERAPEELRMWRREQMQHNGQEALRRDLNTCDAFNVMECLREISIPTLIVCGRDDKLTPVKYAQYLQDHIPHAQLEIIEGAGHMVMVERPEELNRTIERFARAISA